MKREDKELLLRDLCARLPYGVIMRNREMDCDFELDGKTELTLTQSITYSIVKFNSVPYLRTMDSMTEEEIYEMKRICDEDDLLDECGYLISTVYGMTVLHSEVEDVYPYNSKIKISPILNYAVLDLLNAHHLDYRGLIPKGLALPAPKNMYNF